MYSAIVSSLEQVVASPAWSTAFPSVPVYPADIKHDVKASIFFKFTILLSGSSIEGYNQTTRRGELVIAIFTKATQGPRAVAAYCDSLDSLLSKKSFANNKLQTLSSYATRLGTDSSDTTLVRTDYHLPFNYFGE